MKTGVRLCGFSLRPLRLCVKLVQSKELDLTPRRKAAKDRKAKSSYPSLIIFNHASELSNRIADARKEI